VALAERPSEWYRATLISPSRLWAWAMSKLFCIRMSVSIETPNARRGKAFGSRPGRNHLGMTAAGFETEPQGTSGPRTRLGYLSEAQ
jgi:hypothetical protein